MGRSVSAEIVDQVRALHAEGLNDRQVARAVGLHYGTVGDVRRRLGLPKYNADGMPEAQKVAMVATRRARQNRARTAHLRVCNQRSAATRAGVTLEEYRRRQEAGQRWCNRCRSWLASDLFGRRRWYCRPCDRDVSQAIPRCKVCSVPGARHCVRCREWQMTYAATKSSLGLSERTSGPGLPAEELERRIAVLSDRAQRRAPLFEGDG